MGSSPNWSYAFVPTQSQWNEAFAAKQDDLGYSPVNRAGDTMLGRLSTFASVPERSGFAIQQGIAPSSPVDGDIWLTASGLYAQVSGSTIGPIGPGTLTSVGLTAPVQFAVSNSPLTADGDIGIAWEDQSANAVLAGPASGVDAAPTFRALVADDLPNPSVSTKGGVKAYTAVPNQFITSIGTDGTPVSAQPDAGIPYDTVVTAAYTPVATDANIKIKYLDDAGTIVVTISDATSALFDDGDTLLFMAKAGPIQFASSGSVTIAVPTGQIARTADVNQLVTLQRRSATDWVLGGALADPVMQASVQPTVIDRNLSAPPAFPAYGDRYLVAAGASGAWTGRTNYIAIYTGMPTDSGWYFLAPQTGWIVSLADEKITLLWNGTAWVSQTFTTYGTWVPTVGDITSPTPNMATLSIAEGSWCKTGDFVEATGYVVLSNKGSMVAATQAAIYIADLITQCGSPPSGTAYRRSVNIGFWDNITLPAGNFDLHGFMIIPTRIGLQRASITTGASSVLSQELSNTTTMYFDFCYRSTT